LKPRAPSPGVEGKQDQAPKNTGISCEVTLVYRKARDGTTELAAKRKIRRT
jgi:hypothetical protein